MEDIELQIKDKRTGLRNLLDILNVKQKEVINLNHEIEKETAELKLLEKILKVNRAMEDLKNYPDDFKEGLKTWSRKRLQVLYIDMSDEEIDMLHERLHSRN